MCSQMIFSIQTGRDCISQPVGSSPWPNKVKSNLLLPPAVIKLSGGKKIYMTCYPRAGIPATILIAHLVTECKSVLGLTKIHRKQNSVTAKITCSIARPDFIIYLSVYSWSSGLNMSSMNIRETEVLIKRYCLSTSLKT